VLWTNASVPSNRGVGRSNWSPLGIVSSTELACVYGALTR